MISSYMMIAYFPCAAHEIQPESITMAPFPYLEQTVAFSISSLIIAPNQMLPPYISRLFDEDQIYVGLMIAMTQLYLDQLNVLSLWL